MAIELHVFAHDSRIPSRATWQRAIDELGFPAVLDSSLELRQDRGYVPTTYQGNDAGFELYLDPAAKVLSVYPHIAPKSGDRDTCVTFRWGSDLTECAAALSAAAALAKVTDGVYFYPDDDIVYDADEAIAATRRDLSLIESEER